GSILKGCSVRWMRAPGTRAEEGRSFPSWLPHGHSGHATPSSSGTAIRVMSPETKQPWSATLRPRSVPDRRTKPEREDRRPVMTTTSDEDRYSLLRIARRAIEAHL